MLGVVIAVLLLLFILPAQLRTRPIVVRQLLILPIAVVGIGLAVLLWEAPKLTGGQLLYLAAQLFLALVAGLARAAAIEVEGRREYAVRKGSWWLPAGWMLTIVGRFGLDAGVAALASPDAIVPTFPLFLGVTLGVQNAAIYVRARQRDLRFVSPETLRRWRSARPHPGGE